MDDMVPPPTPPEAPAPETPAAASTPAPQWIAADVGGTYARLALVEMPPHGVPRILALQRYAGAEYPSLAAIVRDFRQRACPQVDEAVVAIAGVLASDALVNANLPWPVSVEATRVDAGLARLALVNDFEAVAYAIAYVDRGALVALNGAAHAPAWPALVLGPGTGLGAALRFDDAARPVLASEVGHSALAPGNALELEVLRLLMQRWPHVDNERVLSGSGLMNLYPCLCQLRGASPRWTTPAGLVQAARRGDDPLAAETLAVFCGWLGSLCGDLAIAFGARAVYLTGGIAGHIGDFLQRGEFRARFLNKGVLGGVLQQVPVWRVEHGELGILGAAALHAQRRTLA